MIVNVSISNDEPAIQYYKYCRSFLSASLSQARTLLTNESTSTWSDCTVVIFLFSHSVELFYKSALSYTKIEFDSTHDLIKLAADFEMEFKRDNISIKNPFSLEFIGEFSEQQKQKTLDTYNKPSIRYRYPLKNDKKVKNEPWNGVYGYRPSTMVTKIENFITEIESIAIRIGLKSANQ